MADCIIRDDCSIRVYRSVSYTRVQKSDQAIAGLAGAVPPALQSFRFIPKISIIIVNYENIYKNSAVVQ